MLRQWIAGMVTVLIAAVAMAATAQEQPDPNRRYVACMALAERDAQQAFDQALAWEGVGGGDAAQHCIAKALFYLGQYGEAAQRFEALAQTVKSGPKFKAELLGQAAQGWMLANKPERADDVLSAAIKLNPEDPELRVDRGLARAAFHSYRSAIEDFTRAIDLEPRDPAAFTFRATAHRYLGEIDAATADLERALAINSEDADALLERGILRRLKGDNAGARADWLLVIEQAPGTVAAKTAQDNLQKMDLKVPQ